jgi:hypothetical protein
MASLVSNHAITPLLGSARRLGGAHANLLDSRHYPVEALCLECGRPVRCERYIAIGDDDWIHIERFTLVGDTDRPQAR